MAANPYHLYYTITKEVLFGACKSGRTNRPRYQGMDVLMIKHNFWAEEAKIIIQIPLSKYQQQDILIWRGSTTSEFIVRSAYHMEKDRTERNRGVGSTSSAPSSVWKKIWDMQMPNSIKMFLWRACHNILPTKVSLQKRGIVLDPLCQFCQLECEMSNHILLDCILAKDVWGAC
jgi:hypothetical protein